MSLYFESILGTVSACGPDARFLLEVVATEPELRGEPWREIGVKPLAKRLHLDEKVVSVALSELVAAGVMERLVATRLGRGGRAAVTYRLSPGKDEQGDGSYPRHAELLQTLFSGADMVFAVLGGEQGGAGESEEPDEPEEPSEEEVAAAEPKRGRRQPPGGRGRLSIRNRLLFAVLLSRSDQFGEVQLGLPELGQLTGMQPEQVKNRLFRLMHLGLIRRYVSGLSSKIFALRKVNSTYFLNIDALKPQGAIAVHITHEWEGKRYNHADILRGDCANAEKGEYGGVETPACLLHLLVGQQWEVFSLFQHLLYRYASHLLSRHWRGLASDTPIEDAELKEQIKKDFIRKPKSAVASEIGVYPVGGTCNEVASVLKDGAGGDAGQTCECIYSLAMEVAREYRARFGPADWVDFESADIRILPAMDDIGYRAITIMFQPALVGLGRFTVLHEVTRGNVENWPAVNETELTLQNRMDFGLATFPRRVRRAWEAVKKSIVCRSSELTEEPAHEDHPLERSHRFDRSGTVDHLQIHR